jgi:hypothetical protein
MVPRPTLVISADYFCFDCKALFHGLCQNVVCHPKADIRTEAVVLF